MPDRVAVIEMPAAVSTPELRAIFEELRGAVGLASSLVSVALVRAEAGTAKTGATTGTVLVQSQTAVDFEDARVDQVRVVGWGASTASGHTVRVVDVATSGVLCTADLPLTTAAAIDGAWTMLPTGLGGSRRIRAEVVGNAAATQTVFALSLQGRTMRVVRE